jgi:hypothetical protein
LLKVKENVGRENHLGGVKREEKGEKSKMGYKISRGNVY